MNYLDLFHGIGGFALGAHMAGMKFNNHYCSDIEPYAQELYKLRFPDSIQLGDIAKIDTSQLPGGDWIISGGFPCQDISIAGKGAGIHGKRSGLWFEYWRIINDLRPRFAIMENVGGLVRNGLREVLGSLAEIGYDAEWLHISAKDVGLPHGRSRIWIIAYADSIGHNRRADQERRVFGQVLEQEKQKGSPIWYKAERCSLQSLFDQETESAYLRDDYGLSDWMDRIKGLGNAIVPQIADLLFRQIKENLVDNSQ
jgi:DNA (cytosine-5)-methyltransferase 1